MPRVITVLEDCIRYRDGRKWKRRHCFLTKPDCKKSTVTMFITKQFNVNVSNQVIDEKSMRQYIVGEITGFEHGRHVDKESHVMALIGCDVVYCIAFEHAEPMFRWAETLTKLLTSVNFHVTLRKVSDTSYLFNKITAGTQGNLHVQPSRLCLIGEPGDGNKFICEWTMENLVSVNIFDTQCDKVKKLHFKSNGKTHKGKGYFEFEIGITQKSTFEDTFRNFLSACKDHNAEFSTNFPLKLDLDEPQSEYAYSYSIACSDKNYSNSENSSSLEKRSSEIPIPRSREPSGPDQRPIENVQIKIRKSHKNLQKVRDESQMHYPAIESASKHNDQTCLFFDDEEIEDQVHHKSDNLFFCGLSQESSGVFVTGASDSMREVDLSVPMSVQDDSGCGHFSRNLLPSTSSTHPDIIDFNLLPPCQPSTRSRMTDLFLTFCRNVVRNPLYLHTYTHYSSLLRTALNKESHVLRRSNSFNCVHVPEIRKTEYRRKYSHTNLPLNLASSDSQQHFSAWKHRLLSSDNNDELFLKVQLERSSSETLLSSRLPFKSLGEFHCSMARNLQSGNACVSLLSYHHFLLMVRDVRSALRVIEVGSPEVELEQLHLKAKIWRENEVLNHWAQGVRPRRGALDPDRLSMQPSTVDFHVLLLLDVVDGLAQGRTSADQALCVTIPSLKPFLLTCPTIELSEDKSLEDRSSTDLSTESSAYLELRPVLCQSCSAPDFRPYCQQRQHKLSHEEDRYQNLSSIRTFDSMNHTFPKQNAPLSKPDSADSKEGSFSRFRRKYSPSVFIPFMRRKTSSTHSTLSEPICHGDSREQNSYYNMINHTDMCSKKSLSVVLDSCAYVNVKQSSGYINMSVTSGATASNDSSSCLNVASCAYDDDDDDVQYPEEIVDPSRNYGELCAVRGPRANPQAWLCTRRSASSVLSHQSLRGADTLHTAPSGQRNHPSIGRVHSDACASRFRSTDCIGVRQACGASPQGHRVRQLNYVTVLEHNVCDNFSGARPAYLSVHTGQQNDLVDPDQPRAWPQSPAVAGYCEIDFKRTYALRECDRVFSDKVRATTDELDSRSVTSSSCLKDRKLGRTYFRRLFHGKCKSAQ